MLPSIRLLRVTRKMCFVVVLVPSIADKGGSVGAPVGHAEETSAALLSWEAWGMLQPHLLRSQPNWHPFQECVCSVQAGIVLMAGGTQLVSQLYICSEVGRQ